MIADESRRELEAGLMRSDVQQTLWFELVAGTMARAGLKHAVTSPGSRCTPIVAALLRQSTIRIHSVIDERSAAYLALGLARSSGQPTLLVCTSGTAAANYFPAIVEADQSGIPLIVLTADRPVEAQFASCPQTIDQIQLYGTHVRRFVELGEAHAHSDALRAVQRLVLSCAHAALFPNPGPVHINARARKPLEPARPDTPDAASLEQVVDALLELTPTLPEPAQFTVQDHALRGLTETCAASPRGLIVCGYEPQAPELDGEALADFSKATGYPVWLDVAHPLRWKASGSLTERVLESPNLLWGSANFAAKYAPDVIVQVGAIPTSSQWETWLEREGAPQHFLLARQAWSDPSGRARRVLVGDPSLALQRAATFIEPSADSQAQTSWFLAYKRADARATLALKRFVEDDRPERELGELHAVRAALDACPRGTRIVLGNSLPIRNADLVWPVADAGQSVYAIRGANGIDGVVSTAVGVALTDSAPTLLLIGDISFLHDIGGLYAARAAKSPLAIVVVDNGGGRIFEQLPVARSIDAEHLAYWTTPHALALDAAGSVYGIETTTPSDAASLRREVRVALSRAQATLICARVGSDSARTGTAALRAAVDTVLTADGAPSARS